MKSAFAFLMLASALYLPPATAHKISPGVYTQVPYNNNPDKFCRLGMPQHGWISIAPKLGIWKPISQYYNPQWTRTFERVCAAGGRPAGGGGKYKPRDPAAAL
ncbi:hypothetical protein [Lysobacter enzymogenes]|uniref:hypothetical protein n=1 Tax=Lysobacter enzymogenes TaxID=69 RepID=UPI0019D0D3C1|nr:hypothetical protein [Lysobacter enzymogenes]